jgi:opacity protein-like surface antigen
MSRVLVVLFVGLMAAPAGAQTSTPEPAAPADPSPSTPPDTARAAPRRLLKDPPQTLWLTLSVSGGTNDAENTYGGRSGAGAHEDTDALVTYQRRSGRTTIGAVARAVERYDATLRTLDVMYGQTGFQLATVGVRNQFHAGQSVGYQPFYQFGAAADPAASAISATAQSHGDFANAALSSIESTSMADLTRSIGRRDSLTVGYSRRQTIFRGAALDLTSQSISVRLAHHLTRDVSLRTGYGYRTADGFVTATSRTLRYHDLDLGIDYARALSLSKNTAITFRSGSSIVPVDPMTIGQDPLVSPRRVAFVVTGDAGINRRIGRTWSARLGVNRSVQVLEGFAQPVIANAVSTSVGGSWNRRTSFSSSAGFTSGAVGVGAGGVSGSADAYTSWTGAAGLHIALGRRFGIDAQYSYYGHRFGNAVLLPPGLASDLQRQVARIGLTWRTPIVGR